MNQNIDCVHGKMQLPDYVHEIIATEEFARLRNLKQLGMTNYIFQNATHTRYEHSIGVSHLCQTILETLERNSIIVISDLHKKCVIVAGLLHDLGHGPFSHLWESIVRKNASNSNREEWTHENQSREMVKFLIKKNNIKLAFTESSHQYCLNLIIALITGDSNEWKTYLKPELNFLTEIVSNKYCNIDVDKWDYLLRDAYHLKNNIETKDFAKMFQSAKVVYKDNDIYSHIGYRFEDFGMIENLFENRALLHKEVYQNVAVIGCEQMIMEVFSESEKNGFLFKGSNLVLAHKNSNTFKYLDDSILQLIDISDDVNMNKAKSLIKDMKERKFWKYIWESKTDFSTNVVDCLKNKFGDFFVTATKEIKQHKVHDDVLLYKENGDISSEIS
ncbi:unnamed protein product, partial [Diamesa serratosioi]